MDGKVLSRRVRVTSLMAMVGMCSICGRPATGTCPLCGRLVCRACSHSTTGVCRACEGKQQKTVTRLT